MTSGMSWIKEASVGGRVYLIVVPLEDTTSWVEGWRSGGALWYVPRKEGDLKILGSISMS